jgi:hypothetical protein
MKNLRPEVEACLKSGRPGMHGLDDLMDDMMLSSFNITDDEYDFICEYAEESELDSIVLSKTASFAEKRYAIQIRNKYLEIFNTSKS